MRTIKQLCPVCQGRKSVPQGFYYTDPGQLFGAASTAREPCQQCGATGMVTGTETIQDG